MKLREIIESKSIQYPQELDDPDPTDIFETDKGHEQMKWWDPEDRLEAANRVAEVLRKMREP